jgi:hypothetical protein
VSLPHQPRHLGDVPLYLGEAEKSVETAPNGYAFGLIKFRGWQVHRLTRLSGDSDRNIAYLIQANYEFDIAPDVPLLSFAEIKFEFKEQGITVIDAAPRAVSRPIDAGRYELTAELQFTPGSGSTATHWPPGSPAASIALPALTPWIACSGVMGDHVRWRHTETVPAGTHTGWFVLRVPPELSELHVIGSGMYHIQTDPTLGLAPVGQPDAFAIRLPDAASVDPNPPPGRADDSGRGRPRVFVSYAHESDAHKRAVAELCSFLINQGMDVRFDQQDRNTRRIWEEWITREILRADYVLVIASPAYRDAADGNLPDELNRGVRWEFLRLTDLLFRFKEEWTKKILPVVLPGRSEHEIPLTFLPGIADHYRVDSLDPVGAKRLLRVLQPDRSDC